jgi:hypothetical protein
LQVFFFGWHIMPKQQSALRLQVAPLGRQLQSGSAPGAHAALQLPLAAKRFPRLAGYFTREISRQRTEAKARANREAGAPSTGKVRASKRRAKARKARQSKPAQVKQAPTAK